MSGPYYGEPEHSAPTQYGPVPQEPPQYGAPYQGPMPYGQTPQPPTQYGPVPEGPTQYIPTSQGPMPYGSSPEGPTDYYQNPYGAQQYAPISQPLGPWISPTQPPPPKKRRRLLWGSIIVLVIALIGAGATAAVLYIQNQNEKNSDPRKIEALVGDFSDAVTSGDAGRIAGLMCDEEAKAFQDAIEKTDGAPDNQTKLEYQVRDVTVHGDAASAKIAFKDSREQAMYFRKENGKWTVC